MRHELELSIKAAVKELFAVEIDVELTRPDERFGDFATNIALVMASRVGQSPRTIADALAAKLKLNLADKVANISVVAPGFINLTLNDECSSDARRRNCQAFI
jgi:arginyl-tRNA synthetase